jgi:hypothetical protein
MGLQKQLQDYEHGFRRFLLTRGIKINSIGSDVADFASPISAIMSLISAGTGIPQRVLMGSEQGKLAANQDRSNWEQRIEDRRVDYAGPLVVRTFIDRLIKIGALPTPAEGYEVRWPQLRVMDDKERAAIAQQWSMLNTNAKEVVVTANEIRDRVLQLPNLEEVQEAAKPTDIVTAEANLGERKLGAWAIKSARKILCLSAERKLYYRTKYARFKRHRKPLKKSVITTAAKGAAPGQNHIHEVADRFRVKATAVIKRAFANGKRVFGKPTTQAGMLSAASDAITRTEEGLRKTLLPILAQILATSGQAALDRIPKKTRQAADKPHVDIRFDQTNPDAVEWVKEHGAELIKGISDSTRQQVQDAIEAAFEDKDVDLTALAQEIGDIIGDDDGSRSDTIARTETMDASNAGQQEGWQQAVEAGLLNGDEKQVWIVTDDERLCPICEDFADATAALDENFESKSGEEADGPPAHPNCRCTVGLVAGGE